jgi:HEAT repeat protein
MHLRLTPSSFWTRICHYFSLGIFAFATCVYASPPETFANALKRLNVEVNQESLIQALSDPRKEVRGLAAAELAEMKLTDALPQILKAAQSEMDPFTKVNIAAAATWLGSDDALQMLKGICADRTVPAYVRIDAALNVFYKQDHSCFPSVADIMNHSSEASDRLIALNLASQIRPKTEDEERAVFASALDALADHDIPLRLEACEVFRWIGDTNAIEPIQNALRSELEGLVRVQMEWVLNFLRKGQVN